MIFTLVLPACLQPVFAGGTEGQRAAGEGSIRAVEHGSRFRRIQSFWVALGPRLGLCIPIKNKR
jgi:hypothetical protein